MRKKGLHPGNNIIVLFSPIEEVYLINLTRVFFPEQRRSNVKDLILLTRGDQMGSLSRGIPSISLWEDTHS